MSALWLVAALLAFDPAATVRSLQHADARPGALRQILALGPLELALARQADLATPIASLVRDTNLPVPDRVLAVRTLALLGRPEAVESLAKQAARTDTPEEIAVAREAALALRQMNALDALAPSAGAADPEIRATAAAAGAAPEKLCGLAKSDRWPAVRAAAARGLARHAPESVCLADLLGDADVEVALTAARTLVETHPEGARDALRRVAGDAKAPVPVRVETVVALGRLGDLEPAQRILEKHLADGSVVPLAVAAVRALQEATDAPTAAALLRRALGSPDGSVQAAAARALATRTDPESRAAVLDFLQKLPANERAHVLPDAPEEPAVTGEPEDDAE